MSKIFHLVCFPPSVGHWSKWALSCGTKGKARNTAIALFLITKKSKLPMIPRDVWNIVVWHVYAHTLQKVEMDVESWLKLWVTNPIQQRYNPLYTNHDVIDDWRMFRHQKFPPIVGHFQKQEVSLRISDTAWVYYTSQVRSAFLKGALAFFQGALHLSV